MGLATRNLPGTVAEVLVFEHSAIGHLSSDSLLARHHLMHLAFSQASVYLNQVRARLKTGTAQFIDDQPESVWMASPPLPSGI
jgi:hypothetical protein